MAGSSRIYAEFLTGGNKSKQGILRQIIDEGGNVLACPMCMEVQGVAELNEWGGKILPGVYEAKLRENPTVYSY